MKLYFYFIYFLENAATNLILEFHSVVDENFIGVFKLNENTESDEFLNIYGKLPPAISPDDFIFQKYIILYTFNDQLFPSKVSFLTGRG